MSVIAQYRRQIGLGVALLGLLLVGVWGVQVGGALFSLRGQMAAARALADDPLAVDVASAGEMVSTLRRDVVTLRRNVGWMTGFGRLWRWMPGVGPLLAESRDLLALADGLTEVGNLLWEDIAPVAEAFQAGGLVMDDALALPQQIAGKLPRARIVTAQAHATYRRIDADALPRQFRDEFAQLDVALSLLQEGLAWAAEAPDVLGQTGPRTYLLLALNEDELRPGGGFITGVGEVQIVNGQVAAVNFLDSYAADDFTQPYPLPPEPLRQFMGLDLWVFRDSNWSPDFPTAIRQALALYRPGYPVDVAGVVALDQGAVRELISALGPLEVEGAAVPVTGETLMDFIYEAWLPEDGRQDGEWWQQRKSFMEPLAAAALARIEAGDVDWVTLVQTALRLAEQKHLQVYLRNPQAAALLAARGLDGRVHIPEAGDFVMVVEANVGYNKASPRIAREFVYEVDLTREPPRATLTLDYTHTSQVDIACRVEARYDPVYVQMMDRCYWAHLRAFVPAGARLVDSSRHPIPAEAVAIREAWPGEAQVAAELGGMVFSQAFLLPTRAQTRVQFVYELPEAVRWLDGDSEVYRLTWQKQAGMASVPARVTLRLPENAVVLAAQSDLTACTRPNTVLDETGAFLCEMLLAGDAQIAVKYRVERP